MPRPRSEVCFSTPEGPPASDAVGAVVAELCTVLTKRGYEARVREEPLELSIAKPREMRLVVWGTPTHCAIQLWDEPAESESLDDSPSAHAITRALHELLHRQGYEQEWVGLDGGIGDAPTD